jgi:SAM-dependent methyltransferase
MSSDKVKPKFGNRYLTDEKDVFQHNAWDSVEWDEQQKKEADNKVKKDLENLMSPERAKKLEDDADNLWNKFYETHQRDFFKDRHWIFTEFNELASKKKLDKSSHDFKNDPKFQVFEIGCGVGNTMLPILEMNKDPELFFYGCDFSSVAVDLLKKHKEYDEKRAHAFVLDASNKKWTVPFLEGSLDIIVMIFTLSAIDPSHFDNIIGQVQLYLKPGGLFLFRDYGRYDLAQLRFKPGNCISDNFYVRGDGTRAYFFDEQELHELLTKHGLEKIEMFVDRRLQVNRGKQLKMYRVWVQAKYRKPCETL